MKNLLFLFAWLLVFNKVGGQTPNIEFHKLGMSGNPVIEGWYADPEVAILDDQFWIFPTFSDFYPETQSPEERSADLPAEQRAINPQYYVQTFLDAFSSNDLIHWTKHERVLDLEQISWGKYALWAPSILAANNKYYLFFGANDIQNNKELGGIGVAVADSPSGPFRDAIGKPLISQFQNGAQPIDQFAFRDDDGQIYLYYGGWRHCNVTRLSKDLTSLEPFEDGSVYKEITPEHYVEGPFVFKRNDKYYFMWSEGGWQGPDYSVAYAIGDSPTGPFRRIGKVLRQDPQVATGAGHHSVLHLPKSDQWYIIYHRRPLGDTNGNHREVCIDKMQFDETGKILPVKITFEGVPSRKPE